MGAAADRRLRRGEADGARAENQHGRRRDSRARSEEDSAAAALSLEQVGGGLNRHLSRQLAHGVENRPVLVVVGDHFVADRRQTPIVHLRNETLRRHGEMPERQEHLPFAREGDLFHRRGVDPGDDLAAAVDLFSTEDDLGARLTVCRVREAGRFARPRLHEHSMPKVDQNMNAARRHADAVFRAVSLQRDPEVHRTFLLPITNPVPMPWTGTSIEDRRIPSHAPRKKIS